MRIKLGYPLLIKHVAEMTESLLVMGAGSDCLQAITHITTDSREVLPGDLFVALRTEKDDGHRYLLSAIRNGASAILYDTECGDVEMSCCRLMCRDTMDALTTLARRYADTIPHQTIAVTGSVGKTTTRRYIASVLAEQFRVHESYGNYNNLLGNCLTLLSMPKDTDYLIAECGMNAKGEISAISRLVCPNYAVITNVGISHIAYLGSREEIGREKLSICDGGENPVLLINYDDDYLRTHAPRDAFPISICLDSVDCCDHIEESVYGISFTFRTHQGCITHLHIPTIGLHTLSCAAFAVKIGVILHMDEERIRHGLARYRAEFMRQSRMQIGDATIIFDAYNACPDSMRAACHMMDVYRREVFRDTYALLGDMYELGEETGISHREIGHLYGTQDFKHLFFWGTYAAYYYQGAIDAGYPPKQLTLFEKETNTGEIAQHITDALSLHGVLLVKGSRGMQMERLLPDLKNRLTEY